MRGDQSLRMKTPSSSSGSSPHARGSDCSWHEHHGSERFIPACAGIRVPGRALRRRSSVHPRMRGDQDASMTLPNTSGGSSPHARGSGQLDGVRGHVPRFIPACAGIRGGPGKRDLSGSVHPRMRGDQKMPQLVLWLIIGSSPHARGSGRHIPERRPSPRFIPACAGIRALTLLLPLIFSVHPRMRGDQDVVVLVTGDADGSSPHARGSDGVIVWIVVQGRFIPACAGISWAVTDITPPSAVHPRMRGDQTPMNFCRRMGLGSSPHARGSARRSTSKHVEVGIEAVRGGSSPHARGSVS